MGRVNAPAVPNHAVEVQTGWQVAGQYTHLPQEREREKRAATPQTYRSVISGSTEQAQSDIYIPTRAARVQQAPTPWLLGMCTKDSGPTDERAPLEASSSLNTLRLGALGASASEARPGGAVTEGPGDDAP